MSAAGKALGDTIARALAVGVFATADKPGSARLARELGAAHGYAFRAAEIAYDLGQRHALTGAASALRRRHEEIVARCEATHDRHDGEMERAAADIEERGP